MAKNATIGPFKGMNNMQGKRGDPSRPETILNADNDSQGSLNARQGKQLVSELPGAHSLWSNADVAFVAAKGVLYRVTEEEVPEEICSLGQDGPVHYATVRTDNEQSVYISAPDFKARYDIPNATLNSWGIPIPETPKGSIVEGELQPGLYHICYTQIIRNEMSGNGGILQVNIQEENKGIFLANAAGYQVWVTDPGGGELQRLGETNMITRQPAGGEPLPTFGAYPPNPGLKHLRWYAGRMWAFDGKLLVYSEPFSPGLFNPENYFDFGLEGTMIAPVAGGLYASNKEETFFLSGTDPVAMRKIKVGSGAVPGSLAYIKTLREFGNNVPVWVANQGIMAGSHEGQVVCLTNRKVKLTPNEGEAASIARQNNGEMQYLTSYRRNPGGSGMGMGDSATAEIVRNGKII